MKAISGPEEERQQATVTTHPILRPRRNHHQDPVRQDLPRGLQRLAVPNRGYRSHPQLRTYRHPYHQQSGRHRKRLCPRRGVHQQDDLHYQSNESRFRHTRHLRLLPDQQPRRCLPQAQPWHDHHLSVLQVSFRKRLPHDRRCNRPPRPVLRQRPALCSERWRYVPGRRRFRTAIQPQNIGVTTSAQHLSTQDAVPCNR